MDVDKNRYIAMGAGGFVGMNMVRGDGPMIIGAFVLGAYMGQQAYLLIDGPGSIPDSLFHPVASVEHTLVGGGSLGQTVVTGATAYATYKGAPALYKGGRAAYGMVAGESTAVVIRSKLSRLPRLAAKSSRGRKSLELHYCQSDCKKMVALIKSKQCLST